QAPDRYRSDGGSDAIGFPSEDPREGGTADPALARSHSRAGVELRLPDGPGRIEVREPHVFAAAYESPVVGEAQQLRPRIEGHGEEPRGPAGPRGARAPRRVPRPAGPPPRAPRSRLRRGPPRHRRCP